jgi:hypothetical protein
MITRPSDDLIPSPPCLTLRESVARPSESLHGTERLGVDSLASAVASQPALPARSDLIGRQIQDESRSSTRRLTREQQRL